MHERLDQLEQIFETAPPDARHVIAELHAGQLSFDITAELLHAATDQQAARRDWIIDHWLFYVGGFGSRITTAVSVGRNAA